MSISWLLFKKSGRQSAGRLGLTVAAIGLGTLILLSFVAGINGIYGSSARSNWTRLASDPEMALPSQREVVTSAQQPIAGVQPLKMNASNSKSGNTAKWRDRNISQVSLHATGANSPEFKNLKTPRAGEYYLSPGLDKVAREHPEENIGGRFGTKYLGVIPKEYVTSPDSLEVVRGATDDEVAAWAALEQSGDKVAFNIFNTNPTGKVKVGFDPFELMIFGTGGAILLIPIIMFVAVSTQLGSAQREQRYAALRLIGATRGQVNRVLLLESFIATVLGIIIGSLVFLAVRTTMFAGFEFAGQRFWLDDAMPTQLQFIIMAGLTVAMSLFASWRAMRKVRTSPLGVARREKLDKKPGVWRVLPLAVGVGMFVWLKTSAGNQWIKSSNTDNMLPFLFMMGAILLVMFGLLLAGSWLTAAFSKLFGRFTKNASVLLASRRIAGHSRKVFRSVGGVVLALFAGSFYLAAVSGVDNLELQSVNNNGYSQLKPNTALIGSPSLSNNFTKTLQEQSFVKSVATVYESKENVYIPCADLATYTKHSCAGADTYATFNFTQPVVKNVATVKASELPPEKTAGYLVLHNGDEGAIDKIRSLAITETPAITSLYVADGTAAQKPKLSPVVKTFSSLTYIGIGVTLFVAIASLIVSTIGGLLERRKSLFTLRLGGMTLGQMKRVVMIESLIPLISTSVLAAGAGIWVASIFLETFSSSVRVSLDAAYFIMVIGALIAAIIGIRLVLPSLKKITSLEANQTE